MVNVRKSEVGIIGGAGYIGSALANYLSSTFKVSVLDKNPPPINLNESVEYHKCDILEYHEIERGLKNVDLVIHAAIIQIPQINEQKRLSYQVNLLGTQNVCKVVDETPSIKGIILAGTWHVFGERELNGMIDEEFGFRPDKVENRARLYAFSKISQEIAIRFFDEFSTKIYGVIRMGTVLGEGMPDKTAANVFISRGLKGEPITPYRHSMYRPMLYVDINDVCKAHYSYATKILNGKIVKEENSLAHVVNLCWPEPMTILELAYLVRDTIFRLTKGKVKPKIEVVDIGLPVLYERANSKIKVNIQKVQDLLGAKSLINPKKSIEKIVRSRLCS